MASTSVYQYPTVTSLPVAVNATASISVPYWNVTGRVLLSFTMIIIMVMAICGNGLVILVIARNNGMQTRTNCFLLNLAIADFFCGCIDMPFSLVTVIRGEWIFSDNICQMNGFATPFFFVASIHTLMYIAVFKFISIHNPFHVALNRWRVMLMIGAAWGWAAVIGVLSVTGLSKSEFQPFTTQCGPNFYEDPKSYAYFSITLLTCYAIPLGIIAACYVGIFYEIRLHGQRLKETSTVNREKIYTQQRGILVTLLIVIAAFVITWTPWIAYCLYDILVDKNNKVVHLVNPIVFWFGYANSACNPVIYALRNETFREGYKQIVGKRGHKASGYLAASRGSDGTHLWNRKSRTESSFLHRTSTREKSKYCDVLSQRRRRLSSIGNLPEGFITQKSHHENKEFPENIPLYHLNGSSQQVVNTVVENEVMHNVIKTKHRHSSRARCHESRLKTHHRNSLNMEDVEVEKDAVQDLAAENQIQPKQDKSTSIHCDLATKPTIKAVHGLSPNLEKWLIYRKLGKKSEHPDTIEVFTDIQTVAKVETAAGKTSFQTLNLTKEVSRSVCSLCSNPECEEKHEHSTQQHAKKSICKKTGGVHFRQNAKTTHSSRHHVYRFPSVEELDAARPKHSTKYHSPLEFVEKWYHKHKLGAKHELESMKNLEQTRPLNRNFSEYDHVSPGMFRSSSAPCL